jgi:2-polyprenyl-6-methoxyphenol hydroxylase-like FAD-dependent oxidoreductase
VWSVEHAVIVGAGIGGLAASLVLSRVAARVTLVERAERPHDVGAALGLQPSGMRFWTASDCYPPSRLRVRGLTRWTFVA